MIVMKFGGTSVQDATAINQVAEIVKSKIKLSPVVVVSAMSKVTDALLRIAQTAHDRDYEETKRIIRELCERHVQTARELLAQANAPNAPTKLQEVEQEIHQYFADLDNLARSVATLGELTPRSKDAIVSFGERLSSLIIAATFQAQGINAELVDARDFLITDNHFTCAAPRMDATEARTRTTLLPILNAGRVAVAQGFIGATLEGVTTTIGRGGSDYSAAIIGAALNATAIEIWTDVDGLLTCDPRVVPEARRIRVISFAEAAELSFFGAKVLHPSTVLPAVEKKIPVQIFNTKNPASEGTLILAEAPPSRNLIKAIAFKRGVTVVNVNSTRMLLAHGFLRGIFDVFAKHQTSVDVVTTSEVSVSMTLDSTDRLAAIKRDLSAIGEVNSENEKAIVCVVGDNLKFTPGVAARLFQAISNFNIHMISQGASEINLTFVVENRDVEKVVRQLHQEFFAEVDSTVFE
ncbi:MAG: lysine-sensitive aspartokinase 3 [Acidobacteria bacterium]|nr:lysine-sensitive aspartokinase 3 [Acidobacteriota bacterium]